VLLPLFSGLPHSKTQQILHRAHLVLAGAAAGLLGAPTSCSRGTSALENNANSTQGLGGKVVGFIDEAPSEA
jgi:hypothetical protein